LSLILGIMYEFSTIYSYWGALNIHNMVFHFVTRIRIYVICLEGMEKEVPNELVMKTRGTGREMRS